MELNNWEKELRKQLNEREITPSQNSWDRLDAMLTEAEGTKQKRKYNWLFIAGSILGFILIGTIFFSQSDDLGDVEKNSVVIENKEISKETLIQKNSQTIKRLNINLERIASISKNTKSRPKDSKTLIKNQSRVVQNTEILSDLKRSDEKDSAKVSALNQDYTEVDELLAAVKLSPENENTKSQVKVDAHNLLSEIDGELELSFREKAINTISKKYHNVKLVLSNRNRNNQN